MKPGRRFRQGGSSRLLKKDLSLPKAQERNARERRKSGESLLRF
jgi:hypothetical protein